MMSPRLDARPSGLALLVILLLALIAVNVAKPLSKSVITTKTVPPPDQLPEPSTPEEEEELEALAELEADGPDPMPLPGVGAPPPAQPPKQPENQAMEPTSTPPPEYKSVEETINQLDSSLDLTPKAVAQYLLITGDFEGFDQAVDDLLKANIIHEDEARQYKDQVGYEYEALLKQMVETKHMQDVFSSRGTQGNDIRLQQRSQTATDPALNFALRKMQLRTLLEREATLDELLQALVEEYLLKGMSQGGSDLGTLSSLTDSQEQQLDDMIDLMADIMTEGDQQGDLQKVVDKPQSEVTKGKLDQPQPQKVVEEEDMVEEIPAVLPSGGEKVEDSTRDEDEGQKEEVLADQLKQVEQNNF